MTQHSRHNVGDELYHRSRNERKGHARNVAGKPGAIKLYFHPPYSESNVQSPEIFVFAESEDAVKKFREGNGEIPLVDVVSSFDVMIDERGVLSRASSEFMKQTFGTSDTNEVIQYLVFHGSMKPYHMKHQE